MLLALGPRFRGDERREAILHARGRFPNYGGTGARMPMNLLKFVVLDEEDLEVVSTHLQDAVLKVADVLWRPREKRVVVALNRFDWESAQGREPEYRRRRAALRFERVFACKCRDVNPVGKDATLSLLAVEFSESDAPAGVVTLTFSGGPVLRLEVECLEAELADLGPSWTTAACPAHTIVDEVPKAKSDRA
jgi:hypothetical protein